MNGTPVQQYSSNETDAQQWLIQPVGDGLYSIMSKCNNLYMSLNNGFQKESKIVTKTWQNSIFQKFKLDKIDVSEAFYTIEEGYYEIKTINSSGLVMDVENASINNSANIQVWDDLDEEQQRFKAEYIGDGFYKLIIQKSGKVLDVRSADIREGTAVQQYNNNETDAQKWKIKQLSDGKFQIISKINGLCITIQNDKITRDSNLVLMKNSNKTSQKFLFEKIVKENGYRVLEDGEYEIKSAGNNNLVFDIQCASINDGANLQLWNELDELQQRFIIKYIGNGAYEITVRKSGKVLDVKGKSLKEKSSVEQNILNSDSDYQKWIIRDHENGLYKIISISSGMYMTVQNSNINRDSKIIMDKEKNDISQYFLFDKVLKDKGEQTLEDGEYEIRSVLNQNKIFDIAGGSTDNTAKLQIWDDIDVAHQRFKISYIGNGFYTIYVRKSGKVVDVQDAGLKNGTKVQQYSLNNSNAQKWIIKNLGNNYYSIVSVCNGLYMTINGNGVENENPIVMKDSNGSQNQMFIFDKVVKDVAKKTIEDGEYEIRVAADENLIFDIQGASYLNGAKLQLYTDLNQPQQRFIINYIGGGYYKLIVKHSDKVLDVDEACLKEGTSVQQYTSNNTDSQKWIIKDVGNGYYSFISECNGLYMTSNGTKLESKIVVEKFNNSMYQKFRLEKISERMGIDVSLFQNNINWTDVKNSGIDFAMIRVGYRGYGSGVLVQDSRFTYNIENALKNNIQCGVYFYSQAVTEEEAIEEADFVINAIKKYNITYPVAFDSEYSTDAKTGRADKLSVIQRTNICKAFCDRILNSGYIPMVYASKYWFYDNLNIKELQKYEIWMAHYVSDPKKGTDFAYNYDMWQYTSSGKVNGINGNVDMNIQKV